MHYLQILKNALYADSCFFIISWIFFIIPRILKVFMFSFYPELAVHVADPVIVLGTKKT